MTSQFVIRGGNPLRGRHSTPGNKNAALPMISAAMLADSPVTITNIPLIRDVRSMLEIVSSTGAGVSLDEKAHSVTIDPRNASNTVLPPNLCAGVRTSILFAGAMLPRFGQVEISPPGGDVIGRRRLDPHFDGLTRLGASIDTGTPRFKFSSGKRLKGARIILDEASVTATENILMAAAAAEGETIIYNAACEPHVQNLCAMLSSMGAAIEGAGTNRVTVHGTDALHGCSARVDPDYIESASFIAAAAATGGSITITGVREEDFEILRRPFERLGVKWTIDRNGELSFDSSNCEIKVAEDAFGAIPRIDDGIWPATPTDVLSVLIVLATQAQGMVLFFEKMFESRMYFVDNLINMGAKIVQCDPHRIVVTGPSTLRGTQLLSPDIRAGMALILAGLCASGETTIRNAESIDRGYESVETALSELGADISRIKC